MTFILLAGLMFSNVWGDKLVKTEVTDGIIMLVPQDFRLMSNDEIASKYFTTKRPLVLFTDLNVVIDLGVNEAVTNWAPEDVEIMMSFQKSNIYNLYDEVEIIQEGSKMINGRKFGYMEFVSRVNPSEEAIIKKTAISKYTYIQYVIVDGKSLVFNFTAPSRLREQWKDDVQRIMDSIEISKKFGK